MIVIKKKAYFIIENKNQVFEKNLSFIISIDRLW